MDAFTPPAPPFHLGPDQQAVQDMARRFADEHLRPHALDWDQQKHFPLATIRQAAPLGIGGIYVPEEFGGSGLSRLDAALIFEALATGCPAISAYISIHNMVAGMIAKFGDPAQKQKYLPDLCAMHRLAAYCLTEPGSGSDAAALRTTAVKHGETYRLTGTKQFISGAGAVDLYAIMARTGENGPKGISCFLVEAGAPGLSFGANEKKMGWNAQPTRQVILDNVEIPAANRLDAEGRGFRIAMTGLDGGRLNIGACSLGGAQAALEIALGYVQQRHAFGRPIADFQALQFRLADMATELEAARLLLWHAAAALDAASPHATKLCAMAKRLATDTGFTVANNALQLLGGYGYLADYGIEKLVRDLRVHQILEGTNEIMRVIIAREVLEKNK